MINTNKFYDEMVEFQSDDEDVICRVEHTSVRFYTINIAFYIGLKLCDLRMFLSTLKQARECFTNDPDSDEIRISMYGDYNTLIIEDRCVVLTIDNTCRATEIPINYNVLRDDCTRPWIDNATCERLIDFIESNFIIHHEELANCKDILSVIKQIKKDKVVARCFATCTIK